MDKSESIELVSTTVNLKLLGHLLTDHAEFNSFIMGRITKYAVGDDQFSQNLAIKTY